MSLPKHTERDPHADALLTSALHAADGVEAGDCPDAEVMGLHAERALAGAELRAVEAHVHACPRCQAIVAAFVRALPDEAAVEPKGAVAGTDGESTSGGFAAWFAGWRWLVPAASLTAVAVVAVWVGRGPADQVAESAREALAMAETDAAAPPAEVGLVRPPAAFVPPVGAAGAGAEAARTLPRVPGDRSGAEVGSTLSLPLEAPPEAASAEEAAVSALTGARAKSAPSPEARREAAGALSDRGPVANDASKEATAIGAARGAAPAAAPLQEALNVTPAPVPPPPAAVAPQAATTFRANLVVAPWRVSEGRVERSRDNGATWEPVATPTGVRVIAAGSPGGEVCWLVAEDGVLRTTNGRTWTRAGRPTSEPLTGVVPASAERASVFTASGARWETTNGGRTWTPAP